MLSYALAVGAAHTRAGIVYHVNFTPELRRSRAEMKDAGLVHGETAFPVATPGASAGQ